MGFDELFNLADKREASEQITGFNKEEARDQLLKALQFIIDNFPDQVAAWQGMVNQLIEQGWTYTAARSIVLNQIVADPVYVYANMPNLQDGEG